MNYDETLHYLYEKLPLFSRTGAKAYKADLSNTQKLCESLGNPQNKIKTVHVAGTNGKGSCCHMLAAIFTQNGYRTGLYTSPHLKDFRERIKLNGEEIPRDFVVDFVARTRTITEDIRPSFFELTFVMALDYFASAEVDIAIIETGLGGRLDSTNVITPLVSVITNIGLDHTDILGETYEAIAYEKAGIIKPAIPVVIGEFTGQTKPVFLKKASAEQAEIIFAPEMFTILSASMKEPFFEVDVFDHSKNTKEKYRLDLPGFYQKYNLLTVITTITILQNHFVLTKEKTKQALEKVKAINGLHGRWEIMQLQPKIVLDVAHNPDGVKQLFAQAAQTDHEVLHLIFGMVKDKDIEQVLSLFPERASCYFTQAQIPRALPALELKERAKKHQLAGEAYADVNLALAAAKMVAGKRDLIIVFGSVFIVGEVNS